ncbi:hypothetical protein OHB26_36745 [Nocardia sp. NBC_01503]|uniref:hypothetical protein n=1 Tax=Nocardia sp. NBC_01503 TaxID=2975997 RepID=UPI002E7C0DDB|nr:hypothetical protein [Nocardia sp. NBC_01503]WTL36598.1 hypothetical protein OHB26_36745 [Nocardia sp. NBC_01503]
MGTRNIQTGRHRLGLPGMMHCIEIPAVAAALAEHRRGWLSALLNPARHSFASMRKRAERPAPVQWVPATAV